MADTEIEKERKTGAPDLIKQWEKQIRDQVEAEFPGLPPESKKAIIDSRLKIQSSTERPSLIKDDLGDNAAKKIKENLFECPPTHNF